MAFNIILRCKHCKEISKSTDKDIVAEANFITGSLIFLCPSCNRTNELKLKEQDAYQYPKGRAVR